jgi:hypothetical protein
VLLRLHNALVKSGRSGGNVELCAEIVLDELLANWAVAGYEVQGHEDFLTFHLALSVTVWGDDARQVRNLGACDASEVICIEP